MDEEFDNHNPLFLVEGEGHKYRGSATVFFDEFNRIRVVESQHSIPPHRTAPDSPPKRRGVDLTVIDYGVERDRKRRILFAFYFTCIVLFISLFSYIGITSLAFERSVEADTLSRATTITQKKTTQLEASIAKKLSPEELRESARALGLVEGPMPVFIHIDYTQNQKAQNKIEDSDIHTEGN